MQETGMGMEEFERKYLLKRQDYGVLYPYIVSEDVTDINWNGRQLWIDDLNQGRYMAGEVLAESFVERFVSLISSVSSLPFNKMNPVLEAETEELRISIVHECVTSTGVTISLRKIPAVRRLQKEKMIEEGYCDQGVAEFLEGCVLTHCNIAICGMPGAGKTELLKYLTRFIPDTERVITIEDTLEIHYGKINPMKDCVEMKVAENFTYTAAIKACLRQLPRWIILSEARSEEVRYLLETLSTGTYGMTTLHTDDVRNIPDRIKNMAGGKMDSERILNDTYRFINIGILIKSVVTEQGKILRRIEQICAFDRSGENYLKNFNRMTLLLEHGERTGNVLPKNLLRRFEEKGIASVFGGKEMPV